MAHAPVEGLVRTSPEELRRAFLQACGHSVFSHEQELREGYLRLEGGFRAGVCGTAVLEGGSGEKPAGHHQPGVPHPQAVFGLRGPPVPPGSGFE